MSELFQNKYRVSSTRWQLWNYADVGAYFITICTAKKECYFGNIVEDTMQLSVIGEIASSEWTKTPGLRADMNLDLGEFIVMPNHFHAIINIGESEYNKTISRRDAMHCVSTEHASNYDTLNVNKFGPQSKNLAAIIRGYKSAVTTWSRKNNLPFAWQSRYHDHVIRSVDEYYSISNYIINNPAKWEEDRFFIDHKS
jgi:putative transposase